MEERIWLSITIIIFKLLNLFGINYAFWKTQVILFKNTSNTKKDSSDAIKIVKIKYQLKKFKCYKDEEIQRWKDFILY
jgi:hypothetical protein